MNLIEFLIKLINSISKCITFLYKYRTVYKLTSLVATRKFKRTQNLHKYAVLIAARNEEAVIGNLIDSIRQQDYPSELVDIFVVADNSDDRTYEIAKSLVAKCYERKDTEHRTKGFALQYLVECIRRDYGIDSYEGYFIFDADNLLKSDFISRMNDSFDAGEKIIASYRNTKNFGDNWISASYGIHWLRTIRNEHRARSLFHLATRIQGTGFLFSWELIKNGWNYTSLTEDRAFCADAVAQGYKISYNNEAEFYDEQPISIGIAMRQRIRWAKGHLQAFAETGPSLLKHIFYIDKSVKVAEDSAPLWKKIVNHLRLRFISFDMLTVVYPHSLMLLFKKIIVYILRAVLIFTTGKVFSVGLAPELLRNLFKLLRITLVADNNFSTLVLLTAFTLAWTLDTYLKNIVLAAYIFIIEHKRILPIKWYKKIWFCFTFPLFDLIGKLSSLIALFTKVEWKPIPHKASISISELNNGH